MSKLFQSELNTSPKGSSAAAQAIRDAFLVANIVIEETVPHVSRSRNHFQDPAPPLTLPSWFPSKPTSNLNDAASSPTYIFSRESAMMNLQRAGVAKVSEVYAKFFTEMWDTGRKSKKSKVE